MGRRAERTRLAGIDVGGSALKLGALDEDGSAREEDSLELGEDTRAEDVFARAAGMLRELAGGTPASVGVGLPGLIERDAGRATRSPNLPWLEGVGVRQLLGRELGLSPDAVYVENDANVAALGEQWLGAGRGEDDLLLLTLGTGIGGGLILGGRLWIGAGLGGEVGHMTIEPEGRVCGCGAHGCLETLASASAASRRARERGLPEGAPGDLERLTAIARERPGPERELLEAVGYDLGRGISEVVTLLDLRTFLFGGGFSAALDVLAPGIRRAVADWVYGEREDTVKLVQAELGNSAGWIGAARLALL